MEFRHIGRERVPVAVVGGASRRRKRHIASVDVYKTHAKLICPIISEARLHSGKTPKCKHCLGNKTTRGRGGGHASIQRALAEVTQTRERRRGRTRDNTKSGCKACSKELQLWRNRSRQEQKNTFKEPLKKFGNKRQRPLKDRRHHGAVLGCVIDFLFQYESNRQSI